MRNLGTVTFKVAIELPENEEKAEIAWDDFCDSVENAVSAAAGANLPWAVVGDSFEIVEAYTELPDPEREGVR